MSCVEFSALAVRACPEKKQDASQGDGLNHYQLPAQTKND